MKNIILLLAIFISVYAKAQLQEGKVSKGSIGFGLHWACPQSELQDIEYDDGLGANISYLSRKFPYNKPINFQLGVRMDFAKLNTRKFENIEIETPAGTTPVVGSATAEATNRMYGFLGVGRINFAPENAKLTPYIDLIAGHRNYTTYQNLSLDRPADNPDYQSNELTNRIVHTKRFHYGGSAGVNYWLNHRFGLESSITYTFGDKGAALPLKDIERADGGNELNYNNFKIVKTDLLLINLGIRIKLYKTHSYNRTNKTNTTPNRPSNTRYKDNTTPERNPDPIIKDRDSGTNTTPARTPKKKVPIKIKPDGPTNGGGDRG